MCDLKKKNQLEAARRTQLQSSSSNEVSLLQMISALLKSKTRTEWKKKYENWFIFKMCIQLLKKIPLKQKQFFDILFAADPNIL